MIFGILGFMGSIGQRHGKNLMTLGHQALGYDPALPGPLSREEVIERSDALIICTPTRKHFVDMVDCRHKHILVEKPIAFDAPPEAIRGFLQAKASMGEVVAVGNNLRFHQCVIETKRMLDEGLIGKIGWADFKVLQKTTKPTYLMDGVSRNWGAHEIDLALHLLGPAKLSQVSRFTIEDEIDTEIEFSLQHDSETLSTLQMDYTTEPEKRGYRLVGSNGVIEADLVARTLKVSVDGASMTSKMTDSWDQNYIDEMKYFIEHCEYTVTPTRDIHRLASGTDGVDTHEIIMAVRCAAGLKDKE